MNWLRRTLSISLIAIFSAGIVLVPGLLGIYEIFRWEMLLMIPMVCMVMVFFKIFTDFAELCFKVRPWLRKKIAKWKGEEETAELRA